MNLSLSGYAADNAARRQKGSSVTNQLIGWRSSQLLVVEQAKSLCSKYLRFKLKNCKKLGLQRLKWPPAELVFELRELGMEMERNHPELYQSVTENVGLYSLPSEYAVQNLLSTLATELFRDRHVTWGRIVALYVLAGALAVDCVKLGRPEYVLGLVQAVGNSIEKDLANWIIQQGGWGTLTTRFKKNSTLQSQRFLITSIVLISIFAVFYYFLP
ncbi:bcl-2-related ovarian killer protein homolog A [Parasteatoda tepidariorum]|uniref:bcl-2-related ovarian killer protein homolog A n=1 Tax=Parasteatoda tepidariorum TaxID=114398 RepID=UPI001C71CFCB|nr:bcl-2-related ovarian killer protein homolog A [Parasteatoda tepidariorum]